MSDVCGFYNGMRKFQSKNINASPGVPDCNVLGRILHNLYKTYIFFRVLIFHLKRDLEHEVGNILHTLNTVNYKVSTTCLFIMPKHLNISKTHVSHTHLLSFFFFISCVEELQQVYTA